MIRRHAFYAFSIIEKEKLEELEKERNRKEKRKTLPPSNSKHHALYGLGLLP